MGTSSSGLGNVLKSLARPFKAAAGSGSGNEGDSIPTFSQPTIVGMVDGHDIDQLLYNLSRRDSKYSTNDRIAACQVIRAAVESSSISSIPEIWYAARDLIASANQTECRRAGLRLMKSCIEHDEPAVGSRLSYYRDIINHSNLEDFDLQLAALKSLTNDGRELLDLYQSGYPLPEILTSWVKRLAHETQDIRVGKKKDPLVQWGQTMEENFHNMMKFIINCLKFNITAFDDSDLEAVLREVVSICRKTSQILDISMCCDIIDTVMTYGYIPMTNLSDILEILCGINVTVEQQSEQAWETVRNLVNTHAANTTVLLLCNILEGAHRAEVNSNTMRGAARFLLKLLKAPDGPSGKGVIDLPLAVILASYKNSLKVESVRHGLEVCSCVYEILSDSAIRSKITYEVWESDQCSPLEIVYSLSQAHTINKRSRKIRHGTTSSVAADNLAQSQEDAIKMILDKFHQITTLVAKIIANETMMAYNGPMDVLLDFMLDMSPFLSEENSIAVIEALEADHSCSPLSQNWASNFDSIILNFWQDRSWAATVRVRAVKFARNVYILAWDVCEEEVIDKLIERVFQFMGDENDLEVLREVVELIIEIAHQCSVEAFDKLNRILINSIPEPEPTLSIYSPGQSTPNSKSSQSMPERFQLISRAVARIFVLTFKYSPVKAQRAYFSLVTICERTMYNNSLAFIEAGRILSRIRVATENWVYLTTPTNIDALAANFGRSETVKRPTGDEAWWYPESLGYLADKYLEVPSTVLKRTGTTPLDGTKEIDISYWLKIVVDIIEKGADWDVYSFVLAYFSPQLMNIHLFCECGEEILRLRRVLCDQISNTKIPPGVVPPKEINKLDILVSEIQIMPGLVGYNPMLFTKRDTDFIVQAFVLGLSSWEKTAIACIHGLVVCCYEFPLSIKKFLAQIFAKIQTKITTTSSSPHILEFLLGLSRLPSLTDNFTQDEYKRVFGMAFKYIQHANDLARQPAQDPEKEGQSRYMSQYLLALAYNVIASWFLTLKLPNRHPMSEFITRNLILANGSTNDIDEQGLAALDLISRFTHSDLDLSMQTATTAMKPSSDKSMVTVKRWIYGSSILSIESDHGTGNSQVIIRRPTGTTVFNMRPDDKMIPQKLHDAIILSQYKSEEANGQDSMIVQANDQSSQNLFSPSYYLLQLVVPTDPLSSFKPIALPDEPAVQRALGVFDRAPVVDFHKVGIMYIAAGQSTEQEVLSNQTGSKAYRRFLSRLANLVRLKDNRQIYTGGLDTENNMDGEFAYAWSDKITQMIFHTTTLMPVHNESDTSFAMKKRHIGNNYVNIYYDESGLPFKFDMVKSQFNFINIVISPDTATFKEPFVGDDYDASHSEHAQVTMISKKVDYYRVRVYTREGVPRVFAAGNVKTVSEESLPTFVRNLALVANKFATVWHCEGQYVSNWRYRLQQINQLKERIEEKTAEPNSKDEDNETDGSDLAVLKNLSFFAFT